MDCPPGSIGLHSRPLEARRGARIPGILRSGMCRGIPVRLNDRGAETLLIEVSGVLRLAECGVAASGVWRSRNRDEFSSPWAQNLGCHAIAIWSKSSSERKRSQS